MSIVKTSYNRRNFLKASTAAGGGFLLGFSLLAGCKTDAEVEEIIKELEMPEQWFDMNAFLKIGDNGVVTIYSPNPEIGQNIKTSMPMIVAEELDVDWKNVVVEQAGLDTTKYKRQLAGGSQSIRLGWKSLRTAGATARRMLMEAAAQTLDVPLDELTTEKGIIHHKASGQELGYQEVAQAATTIEVPEEVELKDPKDFRIIGTPTPNVDGRQIVTGAPLFGMDYEEEGMLYAMVQHPPAFGGVVKSFNEAEIKNMPGIVDAFKIETDFFSESRFLRNAFLKNSMIAIVGNSTWEVMKAKRALNAQWETTNGENSKDHEAALSALLEKDTEADRHDGDVDKAFEEAAQVIERTYSAPFLAHNTMSPMNFFAEVTKDKARFVGPIQTPEISARELSKALDIPLENITVDMTRMGGGFGRRLYGGWLFESALISQKVKKPIKLIYSREDDMTKGTYRPAYKVRYKAALDEDNNMTAFSVKGAGVHGGPVWANRFPAGTVDNYKASDSFIESNISTGAWRAPKSNFIAGAEQSFLDEVAELAGKDPIQFRLDLFDKAAKNPIGENNDYDAERYAGVLKLVKEKSGWDNSSSNQYRGVASYFCHNTYVAQVIDLEYQENDLVIKKVWCAVDCGIVVNPMGAKNQIEGGVVDGIGHAMFSGLTFENGVPQQSNFHEYNLIRHNKAPLEVETFFVDNGIDPTGLGEPGLPPVMGALANAMYKLTGKRFYDQPFSKEMENLG